MVEITVTVCNICKDVQRGTQKYELASDGRSATVDLCEEHAEPLERLLGEKPKRRARKGLSHRVMTMEEIEAAKGP